MGEVFSPQMAEVMPKLNHPDADLTSKEDEPIKEETVQTMASSLSDQDNTSLVYYGDPIVSFRQCLKRYNYHSTIVPSGVLSAAYLQKKCNNDFPYYRGYAPGAIHTADTTPYNYCHMTLLNYITPAFGARRGGIRWKYMRVGGATMDRQQYMAVIRNADSGAAHYEEMVTFLTSGTGNVSDRARAYEMEFPHTWDGAAFTTIEQNPVLEVEMPLYNNVRFVPAKLANMGSGGFLNFHWLLSWWQGHDTNSTPAIHAFVSIAEDFTLGFYLGPPVAYRVLMEDEPASSAP
jgi:hypothetical protein